jgi:putative transposase
LRGSNHKENPMQVVGLPGHIIRNARGASRLLAAQTPDIEAARRRDAPLARWRKAMAQGLTGQQAARAVGVPRATLYRWRKRAEPVSRRPRRVRQPTRPRGLADAVERLRLDHPMWGKEKLGPILRSQGWATSNATVGRILGDLIGRGRVAAVPALIRKVAARSSSKKRPHAIRKPKGVSFEKPGDIVQIDTLSIYPLPGVTIKHFNAYDPFAKWTVARPCKQATAKNAASFLDKVLQEMPDPVKAIQIDGGSEFMAEFEQACADKKLPLYALPPRSPKLNGAVERCNGAWRYEFYACVDLPLRLDKIHQMVDAFQHLYNHHRPHGALAGKTPAQYLSTRRANHTPQSHMA